LKKFEEKKILNVLREVLDKHPVRALTFAKSVAFIAVPTILLIGKYKSMKFGKFFFWATLVCLLKDFTVLFLGFGLGISLESFLGGYDIYRIVGIILALLAVAYILFTAYREEIEDFTVKTLKKIK
jgi:membrane protein DedA with SNARE-associated domain